MPASQTTAARRKAHESLLLTQKQVKRIKRAGGQRAESSPDEYTVTDPDAHAVRRAIEDRRMERELMAPLRRGWED